MSLECGYVKYNIWTDIQLSTMRCWDRYIHMSNSILFSRRARLAPSVMEPALESDPLAMAA
jgi:hypothetical protein